MASSSLKNDYALRLLETNQVATLGLKFCTCYMTVAHDMVCFIITNVAQLMAHPTAEGALEDFFPQAKNGDLLNQI